MRSDPRRPSERTTVTPCSGASPMALSRSNEPRRARARRRPRRSTTRSQRHAARGGEVGGGSSRAGAHPPSSSSSAVSRSNEPTREGRREPGSDGENDETRVGAAQSPPTRAAPASRTPPRRSPQKSSADASVGDARVDAVADERGCSPPPTPRAPVGRDRRRRRSGAGCGGVGGDGCRARSDGCGDGGRAVHPAAPPAMLASVECMSEVSCGFWPESAHRTSSLDALGAAAPAGERAGRGARGIEQQRQRHRRACAAQRVVSVDARWAQPRLQPGLHLLRRQRQQIRACDARAEFAELRARALGKLCGRGGEPRKAVKVLAGCGAVAGGWRRVPEAGL